jgi:1-acyl-sn-glycerol-3-phosphate acyltransferase
VKTFTSKPTWFWRAGLALAALITRLLSRLELTSTGRYDNAHGLILAANHINPFDPIALTAACRRIGLAPRFLAQEGLFTTPVIGSFMRWAGHIRVDRDKPTAPRALHDALDALARGDVILVYPEGRISRDPGLWPERGKTGTGRLALQTKAALVPVAIWGSHEVLPYAAPQGMWPAIWRALRHRPVVKVHFGQPLDVSDVDVTRPGAAQKITDRLMDAIVSSLEPLRQDEPGEPRHLDPTRQTETRRTHRRSDSRTDSRQQSRRMTS